MRKVVLGSFLLWAVSGRHTQKVSWLIFTVTKMKTEGDNSAKTGAYGTLRVTIKMVKKIFDYCCTWLIFDPGDRICPINQMPF